MNEILSTFLLSDLLFLVTCVVMSLIIGSLWFHPRVFGTLYARWMGLPIPKPGAKMPKGMAGTFMAEIISRVMYFWAIVTFFSVVKYGEQDGIDIGDLKASLYFLIFLHTCFVFPAQLSLIAWTKAQKKAVILISGNTLIQTLLAVVIWYAFFA